MWRSNSSHTNSSICHGTNFNSITEDLCPWLPKTRIDIVYGMQHFIVKICLSSLVYLPYHPPPSASSTAWSAAADVGSYDFPILSIIWYLNKVVVLLIFVFPLLLFKLATYIFICLALIVLSSIFPHKTNFSIPPLSVDMSDTCHLNFPCGCGESPSNTHYLCICFLICPQFS